MRGFLLITGGLVACAVTVVAAPRISLQGTLELRGATIIDAPREEPKNTHAAFLVTGDAARALYEAISVEPHRDECLDDGSLRKSAGHLACVRLADERGYECDFAIELATQEIEPGRAC